MTIELEHRPNRRRVLVVSCGVVFGSIVHGIVLGASSQPGGLGFVESACPSDVKTAKRILIAYASKYGSTGTVAQAIGEVLCSMGNQVDVRLLKSVQALTPYDAVIVGSPVYMGKWLPEAVDFVKGNKAALSQLPVAYFVVCLTMKDDTPESRAKTTAYLDPVRLAASEVEPSAVGLFPGVVDFSKMSFMHKSMLRLTGTSEGDYRNFAAVKGWSSALRASKLWAPHGK